MNDINCVSNFELIMTLDLFFTIIHRNDRNSHVESYPIPQHQYSQRRDYFPTQDGASWNWQWEIYYNFMGTSYISLMEIFENWQCSRIIIVNAKWLNLLK